MARSLAEFARLLIGGESEFKQQHSVPVLIWESAASAADREQALLSTRATFVTRRPRSGDPLVFEVRKGSSKANAFAMGITVGRTDTNDVAVEDDSVSRFHAWLQQEGRSWKLVDAESKNGTWIGAMKLQPKKPELLQDGARVRFGDVEMLFLLPDSFYAHLRKLLG